jgi:hypothetical protein
MTDSRLTLFSPSNIIHSTSVRGLAVSFVVYASLTIANGAAQTTTRHAATTTPRPTNLQSINTSIREIKAIDGHALLNTDDLLKQSGYPGDKFHLLRQERLWATTELDQQRSELSKIGPHQRPIQVPAISEEQYSTRVSDIDSKVRLYEAQQNNKDMTETQKSEARAQLIDLTRQKARAALELITYRKYQQELSDFDDTTQREGNANAIVADTLAYLARLDGAISELMTFSRDESWFRLEMGAGFLILVTLLIVCFFIFASRSGSIKDILSNDRGLQFITLFSLVIAITLFGLLNILESKELAALLGGLSGYILGRSNFGTQAEERRRTETHPSAS